MIIVEFLLTSRVVSVTQSTSMSIKGILKRVWDEVINAKLGLLSFTVNFAIVYWVNSDHGLLLASVSAFKDGLGKFFLGGFFGRISERFSEIRNPLLAYPLGSIVPTVMAYSLFFIMHYLTATPEPLKSTLYPMFVSMFISTPTTIFVLRRGYMRQNMKKPAVKDRGVWLKRQQRKAEKLATASNPEIQPDVSGNPEIQPDVSGNPEIEPDVSSDDL